eukprot:TRINITY_DN7475_c0_g3_i1.p3 TRINITY_DN7475_c0_g3~~TRINITY_DN7475_c0_g3_i1.p3  ORF type:complete len:115 (-),score=29.27 TRINITY_DN7475_c0_g3_i1:60-404(-)
MCIRDSLQRVKGEAFDSEFKATVGVEFGAKEYKVQGKLINAQIWDTAGQERFRAITAAYYKGAQGAIVVYDITRKSTFGLLDKWIDDFRAYAGEEPVILIIGNKCDLELSLIHI